MSLATGPQFVIFGGSFNPVHSGHVSIAGQLSEMNEVTQVCVVPAAVSPFKLGAAMLPPSVRHQMVRMAMADMPKVAVLDWEIVRPGPSYTVDTVAAFRGLYPAAQVWVAMGLDVFGEFAKWHQAGAILDIAGLLVFGRAGGLAESDAHRLTAAALPTPWDAQTQQDAAGNLITQSGRRVVWHAPIRVPEVSSSAIWESRDLSQVPEPARELLTGHWQTT